MTAAGGVAGLSLAACGTSRGAPATETGTAPSATPAAISYWTSWSQDKAPILNQGMALFQQQFPAITVDLVAYPGADKITAAFAAGAAPDAFWTEGQVGPRLVEGGQLLELSSRVKTAKINLEKE